MSKSPAEAEVIGFVDRYLEAVFPSMDLFKKQLTSGQSLVFYFGIDPTGPELHLGHTVGLTVLKQLIAWGHKGILLIGDFTARIGDPTGKTNARRPLSSEEVAENMKHYLEQARLVLGEEGWGVRHNSEWLEKMTFADVVRLASRSTVQQMLARDMFQERIKAEKPIGIHEFLYPLMQGYDSVAMGVDGEIGGNDQTFNMLVGRDLMKELSNKEKLVLATKLLVDPETGEKFMSKTAGDYISLADQPNDFFGKVMALPDNAILPLFSLGTEVAQDQLDMVSSRLKNGENPKIIKSELAKELVRRYYGQTISEGTAGNFTKVFSEGGLPDDILGLTNCAGQSMVDLLVNNQLVTSRAEAKRLVEQGGVRINEQVVSSWDQKVQVGEVIKIGARRFVRVVS